MSLEPRKKLNFEELKRLKGLLAHFLFDECTEFETTKTYRKYTLQLLDNIKADEEAAEENAKK